MKPLLLSLFIVLFGSFWHGSYASTSGIIFSDDFSNPSDWTSQGSGDVYIGSGQCHFSNVYSGDYNRVYRSLTSTLPTTYWRAECEFTILNQNPIGNGTGEVVLALTAGDLDFMSMNAQQFYEETYQDGIAIVLLSNSSSDNDINNWYFMIEAKRGNYRTYNLESVIFADASVSVYYLRLERLTENLTQLSVFIDSTYSTKLQGSPVFFEIDPLIGRLSFIQHGTITPGYYSRLINATLDRDVIYDYPVDYMEIADVYGTHNDRLLIYPNPTRDLINIQPQDGSEMGKIREYRIFNLLGKEITTDQPSSSNRLDISGLSDGVFILLVTGAEKTFRGRFEKK